MKIIFLVVVCITAVELFALHKGVNGVALASSIGALGAIGGGVVTYSKLKLKEKKRNAEIT